MDYPMLIRGEMAIHPDGFVLSVSELLDTSSARVLTVGNHTNDIEFREIQQVMSRWECFKIGLMLAKLAIFAPKGIKRIRDLKDG